MTDYNRGAVRTDPMNPAMTRRPVVTATAGPVFGSTDVAAVIAWAVMNLGPLAMAAFWAPFH